MRLRAERAEERIRECALIMGVPDGGQYLNDWKDAKGAAVAERDRLREVLRWVAANYRATLAMTSVRDADECLVAADLALAGRGENEGEREP
jgi:hypothetical protein